MLLHDVALQNLHVVLAVDRAGLVGSDGPTHHGSQDVCYLTQIPNMTVLCPACFDELRSMLRAALAMDGPVAVRYPRGTEGRAYPAWNGDSASVLRRGRDVTLISYGTLTDELFTAADTLAERGIEAEIIKLHRIAPLDTKPVLESVRRTGRLLVLEDCREAGSVGQRLAAALAQSGAAPKALILKNLNGRFAPQGTVRELRRLLGLDAQGIVETVLALFPED